MGIPLPKTAEIIMDDDQLSSQVDRIIMDLNDSLSALHPEIGWVGRVDSVSVVDLYATIVDAEKALKPYYAVARKAYDEFHANRNTPAKKKSKKKSKK